MKSLAEQMSADIWYGTQTVAYALMAIGKYLDKYNDESKALKGYVQLSNGSKMEFDIKLAMTSIEILDEKIKSVKIVSENKGRVFVSSEWSGVPLRDGVESIEKNLRLNLQYVDENKNSINVETLKQNQSFFILFDVQSLSNVNLQNIVLSQLLPSGWEIENLRLNNEEIPQWLKAYDNANYNYFDMRDDRASWFFNLNQWEGKKQFYLKINVVTAGEFYLPPTLTEAMYDRKYRAIKAGKNIKVIAN
jgi:uncharacterized protein YfaS (alpha-2-macroglobulin family)